MNIIDLHDPTRVNKSPDDVNVLFSSGQFIQDEFKISRVELRLYYERTDEKFGVYSKKMVRLIYYLECKNTYHSTGKLYIFGSYFVWF